MHQDSSQYLPTPTGIVVHNVIMVPAKLHNPLWLGTESSWRAQVCISSEFRNGHPSKESADQLAIAACSDRQHRWPDMSSASRVLPYRALARIGVHRLTRRLITTKSGIISVFIQQPKKFTICLISMLDFSGFKLSVPIFTFLNNLGARICSWW